MSKFIIRQPTGFKLYIRPDLDATKELVLEIVDDKMIICQGNLPMDEAAQQFFNSLCATANGQYKAAQEEIAALKVEREAILRGLIEILDSGPDDNAHWYRVTNRRLLHRLTDGELRK